MVKKVILGLVISLSISCNKNIEFRENAATFLVPKPIELTQQKGFFNIDKNIRIATSENLLNEATYLQKLIEGSSNFKPTIVNDYDISQLENVIFY